MHKTGGLPRIVLSELARHDFDPVYRQGLAIVKLEHGIFHNKGPYLITQAVVVQVALDGAFRLDIVGQRLRDGLVELLEDFHREDRIDVP